jgi:hypothetical protein
VELLRDVLPIGAGTPPGPRQVGEG